MTTRWRENLGRPSRRVPAQLQDRAEMHEILARVIQQAERRTLQLRVPHEAGKLQKHREMHFHYKPEVFIQTQGMTIFQTPREKCVVKPGEVCVMPAGIPHAEHIEADAEGRFRNLVIGFYSNTLSVHFAHETDPGRPGIEAIEFFDLPNIDFIVELTNHLVAAFHQTTTQHAQIVRGLFLALTGMFQHVVESGGDRINREVGKVFQTKWLVREQVANPELNVKNIAQELNVSADYRSRLFHQTTGEKLIRYIQRMRVEGAMLALETTNLYISEIAWSSGFQDAAYFARVFRRHTGESPQSYRDNLTKKRQEQEHAPKTIYFDREDYTHGEPVLGWR